MTLRALQAKKGAGKDAEMSPFEAARKLLSLDSRELHLGERADLVFQDPDLIPLLIQVASDDCCSGFAPPWLPLSGITTLPYVLDGR